MDYLEGYFDAKDDLRNGVVNLLYAFGFSQYVNLVDEFIDFRDREWKLTKLPPDISTTYDITVGTRHLYIKPIDLHELNGVVCVIQQQSDQYGYNGEFVAFVLFKDKLR